MPGMPPGRWQRQNQLLPAGPRCQGGPAEKVRAKGPVRRGSTLGIQRLPRFEEYQKFALKSVDSDHLRWVPFAHAVVDHGSISGEYESNKERIQGGGLRVLKLQASQGRHLQAISRVVFS